MLTSCTEQSLNWMQVHFEDSSFGQISSLFFGRSVDGVVDTEDVLGVDSLLDLLLPVKSHRGKGSIHKALSQLSNTVMVRNAATAVHDLISGSIFDLLVNFNNLI